MFESLQGSSGRSAAGSFGAFLFSMLLHGLMVTLLAVLPLVFLRALPGSGDLLAFLIAPPAKAEIPVAPTPRRASARREIPAHMMLANITNFNPDLVPKGLPAPTGDLPEFGLALGIVGKGLISAGSIGSDPGLAGLIHPAPPVVVPPPPKPPGPSVVRVGGTVQDAKLIRKVAPVYPEISKKARVSGDVILEVSIDEEGNVTGVRVVRGHMLLVEEAVRAVKQWKYSPTLLNGEPVAVVAAVTVVFQLR